MSESLVVVGVLARSEAGARDAVAARCAALPGVTAFPAGDAGQFGLLIEAPDLESAHACLREQVGAVPGVLGTWPVAVELAPGGIDDTR